MKKRDKDHLKLIYGAILLVLSFYLVYYILWITQWLRLSIDFSLTI